MIVNISDSEYNNIQKENEEDFTYNITNNQIEITGYKNIQSKIIIPENIENHPVTTISMNLNYTPKEIYLPSGVTLINTLINENINNNFYFTLIIEVFATILILIITFILNNQNNHVELVYIAERIGLYLVEHILPEIFSEPARSRRALCARTYAEHQRRRRHGDEHGAEL